HPDYTGIRPKLYRMGEPVPDFAIHGPQVHGQRGLVVLYGIESPGLTASLAIGEMVAGMLAGGVCGVGGSGGALRRPMCKGGSQSARLEGPAHGVAGGASGRV